MDAEAGGGGREGSGLRAAGREVGEGTKRSGEGVTRACGEYIVRRSVSWLTRAEDCSS